MVKDSKFQQIIQMLYTCAKSSSCISILCNTQHLLKHGYKELITYLTVCFVTAFHLVTCFLLISPLVPIHMSPYHSQA